MLGISQGNSYHRNGHRSVLCYHSSTAGRRGGGSDGPVTSGDKGGWSGGGSREIERERWRQREVKGSLNLICVLHSSTGAASKTTPAGLGKPGISKESVCLNPVENSFEPDAVPESVCCSKRNSWFI